MGGVFLLTIWQFIFKFVVACLGDKPRSAGASPDRPGARDQGLTMVGRVGGLGPWPYGHAI
jgi:hypothetical protein